ncbi:MAG: hypothetical protein NDI75_04435 [Candidatus Didemnitutus sp.]|jgi:hypothetical protein|nr:hypothetical protein [Candidatus Didemnitutus sp.]
MKKTTAKKTPVAKKAAVTKAPTKKATAPAAAATVRKKAAGAQSEAPATFISARLDIGFGNHLYLRGEGPGLSWDHGIAMDCVAADGWAATLKGATSPVIFKVLINDVTWCTGNDYVVEPGQSVTVTPSF